MSDNVDQEGRLREMLDGLKKFQDNNQIETDGKWLEQLTVQMAALIPDWDIRECWSWGNWPDRIKTFPKSTKTDPGVDIVAVRRSDGELIAMQCKARKLDEFGHGADIVKKELDSFIAASATNKYAERWLVTNGGRDASGNAQQLLDDAFEAGKPPKLVNLHADLDEEVRVIQHETDNADECPHCAQGSPDDAMQTMDCMQREAVNEVVRLLAAHRDSESGGCPKGQARGRLILPCGTGKTRVALRIVERLTPSGNLALVLCPSIALVAQIRREFLQQAAAPLRALAVCSDQTAGYDPKQEDVRDLASDPTADGSNVSANWVKGKVTTDAQEIAKWIRDGRRSDEISVIFGTYQSGRSVADAMSIAKAKAEVLVADEAHRTAGLKLRKKAQKGRQLTDEAKTIRDFTLCHDNNAIPAVHRIYQTATPRIYEFGERRKQNADDNWEVRSMDDEKVFGIELYRRSYQDAVRNGWLSDYRIIAIGVNDSEAFNAAEEMAAKALKAAGGKGRHALSSSDCLRGLAFTLAMSGGVANADGNPLRLASCIAFMNKVRKSKDMANGLRGDAVREWVQEWLHDYADGRMAADCGYEHIDAKHSVAARDNTKRMLAGADADNPFGVVNVGIFGEGTDAPSLSAVAFLEPRKSPIDVVQAVGRAMRKAPGKQFGYIICPLLIPPNAVPETWLSTSGPEDGWRELGQVLSALRAHDQRIEDELSGILHLHLPKPPTEECTLIGIAQADTKRIHYLKHIGKPNEAAMAVERVLTGQSYLYAEFQKLNDEQDDGVDAHLPAVVQVITGRRNSDESLDVRRGAPVRDKPKAGAERGEVNIERTKKKARDMINKQGGHRLPRRRKNKPLYQNRLDAGRRLLALSGMVEHGEAIKLNLLSKSGLARNRVARDMNILADVVREAARHLNDDDLRKPLDRHFGLDNLRKDTKVPKPADGCTVAALLMMNAAMLHQRIVNGGWIPNVENLADMKESKRPVTIALRQWHKIISYDFKPVLEPAVQAMEAVEDTGRTSGLERALRHIATEAERIAETYADMGADHAGPLFNSVMGRQKSDGAYFTRPAVASLVAKLALDACGEVNWARKDAWRMHKAIDLACGSGTLLAALLSEMKGRAKHMGANKTQIAALQKLAVEETMKGFDVNPVSLQLAASQLTQSNQDIRYRRMGLHLMPYGPQPNGTARAGTLEMFGQGSILPHDKSLVPDEGVTTSSTDGSLHAEDAVEAAKGARIVIMNPPFTNRAAMGEKFLKDDQKALRTRVDDLLGRLDAGDLGWRRALDKNSIGPMFVALADKALAKNGVLAMVHPTIALTGVSGLRERQVLARRFHVQAIVSCHLPGQVNMSQNTGINESIVVFRRRGDAEVTQPTKIISLDRMPLDDAEATALHSAMAAQRGNVGILSDGWGEVSLWPRRRIEEGNWSAAAWRSPVLADAAAQVADLKCLVPLRQLGQPQETGRTLRGQKFHESAVDDPSGFPIIKTKSGKESEGGQRFIRGRPDQTWARGANTPKDDEKKLLRKAGHLLIAAGQDTSTARLTAVAADEAYIGNSWMPVGKVQSVEAKALAVFLNSTMGRLQLMRHPGKKLAFPIYSVKEASGLGVPDVKRPDVAEILTECWEATKDWEVPPYGTGECKIRARWDAAVVKAMAAVGGAEFVDADTLNGWRALLHEEPHVKGLGRNQYADATE